MLSTPKDTGVIIPPEAKVLDVKAAIDSALQKALPVGRTKALVAIGRMEGKDFVGEVAWVQKVNDNWAVTAGLKAGTSTTVSGQVLIAGSWK
jgi:hypothetical protein